MPSTVPAHGELDSKQDSTSVGATSLMLIMFSVLLASYVVNAMDRQIFPLLASDIRRDYGFTLAETGLLSTIFTLGMAIAGAPTGFLLSRYSRMLVLQTGIAIFSIGTVLTAVAFGFSDMLLWRAITGVGEAMQLTALIAVATGYFSRHKAMAVGAINASFGVGSVLGPVAATGLIAHYGTWHSAIISFGLIGFVAMLANALLVSHALTEANGSNPNDIETGGASSLRNRNTVILSVLSIIAGLIIYGYLGMYPTFLREELKFSAVDTGSIMMLYGLGVLASIAGGWLGDRFSARTVLSLAFLVVGFLGYTVFNFASSFSAHAVLALFWGFVVSGIIYVNLAGYHVKSVKAEHAAKATGLFVTTLYGSGALAGYIIGLLASKVGWGHAGILQITAPAVVAAILALALAPSKRSI
jgi:MFS transporter, DHA1 family, inner membrane transport protein